MRIAAGLLLAGLMTATGGVASGQSTTGEVGGVVHDAAGNAVGGARVAGRGPQGERRTTAGPDGHYLLELLVPGSYQLTASAPGFLPATHGAQVVLEEKATVDFALLAAEAEESITVLSSRTVDATSSATSTSITSDLIGSVPSGRTFSSLVNLAPGVVDGGGGPLTAGNPSIGGASAEENQYLVDGLNITNPGYGALGSYSTTYGSLGSGVNFDFIDAVNLRSAGFQAEYGEATGGIVEVITKRGTNVFHGSIFANLTPRQLEASPQPVFLTVQQAQPGGTASQDYGATIGGPILHDRLFFFAAVNPQSDAVIATAPANTPLNSLGPQVRLRERTSYAASLSWNLDSNNTLDLSLFGDPGTSQQGWQTLSDLQKQTTQAYSTLQFGGDNQVIRYTGVYGSFASLEASAGRATNNFSQTLPTQNNVDSYVDLRNPGAPVFGGGIGAYDASDYGENDQYGLKISNYLSTLGAHELRYGAGYQSVQWNVDSQYSGPPGGTFRDPTGALQTLQTGAAYQILTSDKGTPVYRVFGTYSNPNRRSQMRYLDFFIQDKYQPIPTLTADIGLRTEQQTLVGNPETYTFKFADNLEPRVGLSWDFTGQGRGKVFAHYGRYIIKMPNDLAIRDISLENDTTQVDYFSSTFTAANQIPNGVDPVHGSALHDGVASGLDSVAPGTKSEYQDEYTAGAEYEPFPLMNTGLRYVHRQVGRIIEDYDLVPVEQVLSGAAQFPSGEIIGNPGASLNGTCPPPFPHCWANPTRLYDALELTLEKRLSDRWQLMASYTLSRLWGNYEGFFRASAGQADPGISYLYDFPNNTPLMRGQAENGVLDTDRTHVAKVSASWQALDGFTIGSVVSWESGTPITGYDAHPYYQDPGEIPVGARGAHGRTPSILELDLHVEYAFALSSATALHATADVFNLLDNQSATTVDQNLQQAPGVPDPDFLKATAYNPPRTVRLGLKVVF